MNAGFTSVPGKRRVGGVGVRVGSLHGVCIAGKRVVGACRAGSGSGSRNRVSPGRSSGRGAAFGGRPGSAWSCARWSCGSPARFVDALKRVVGPPARFVDALKRVGGARKDPVCGAPGLLARKSGSGGARRGLWVGRGRVGEAAGGFVDAVGGLFVGAGLLGKARDEL